MNPSAARMRELIIDHLTGKKPQRIADIATALQQPSANIARIVKDLEDNGTLLGERRNPDGAIVYSVLLGEPGDEIGNRAPSEDAREAPRIETPRIDPTNPGKPISRADTGVAVGAPVYGPGGAAGAITHETASRLVSSATYAETAQGGGGGGITPPVEQPPAAGSAEPARRQRRIKPDDLVATFQRLTADAATLAKIAPLIRRMSAILDQNESELGPDSEPPDVG